MPKYAIIKFVLQSKVDFNHKDQMMEKNMHEVIIYMKEIEQDLHLLI